MVTTPSNQRGHSNDTTAPISSSDVTDSQSVTGIRHHHKHRHHHHHQHQQQNNNSNKDDQDRMNDFMDLFTSTVQSLTADAACIREITSLAELTGVQLLPETSSSAELSSSMTTGTTVTYQQQQQQQRQFYHQQELIQLDKLIANIEQKVVALREIINEENQALVKFETILQDEAKQQDAIIQEMLSLVVMMTNEEEQETFDTENDRKNNRNFQPNRGVLQPRRQQQQQQKQELGQKRTSIRTTSLDSSMERSSLSKSRLNNSSFGREEEHDDDESTATADNIINNRLSSSSDSSHHRYNRPTKEISFQPVSEEELLEQKRNVPFGLRVSRYDLNDTMEEIQQVLQQKMAKMEERTSHLESRRTSSNSLQRRFDYLRQRQQGSNGAEAIETDAHSGYWWVTEQELRENCAFFRHGESSARAILSLLCSLRRLKQIPGKNMEVTYLWL
ncbi:hypothetical protein IV203_006485 [Nitzschia inconspicua]|uniref:Uncharacterized protein n=1 Tax=Nitzschia inconspicua TaxID=303405 RepID=A0A9K3K9A4_9STRA|nr:hypothetical protein IV203_006648 [Nitzschia inconspicua]KAG7340081.1 hypothetical protein IV203_006485 [Nitzschia inconspicua]